MQVEAVIFRLVQSVQVSVSKHWSAVTGAAAPKVGFDEDVGVAYRGHDPGCVCIQRAACLYRRLMHSVGS